MKKILLMASLVLGSHLYAGQGSGNGGNGVVCFDNPEIVENLRTYTYSNGLKIGKKEEHIVSYVPDKYLRNITKIEILDLYDAKKPSYKNSFKGGEVYSLLPGEKNDAYARRLISRFNETHPEILKTYEHGVKKIGQQIFGDYSPVYKVDDVTPITRPPSGCVLTTIMRQDQRADGSKVLNIDLRLFNHKAHSDLSKAVYYLHEFLYAGLNHKMSDGVRRLVVNIIKKESFSLFELNKDLKAHGIRSNSSFKWLTNEDASFVSSALNEKLQKAFVEISLKNVDYFYSKKDWLKEKGIVFEKEFVKIKDDINAILKKYTRNSKIPLADIGGISKGYNLDSSYAVERVYNFLETCRFYTGASDSSGALADIFKQRRLGKRKCRRVKELLVELKDSFKAAKKALYESILEDIRVEAQEAKKKFSHILDEFELELDGEKKMLDEEAFNNLKKRFEIKLFRKLDSFPTDSQKKILSKAILESNLELVDAMNIFHGEVHQDYGPVYTLVKNISGYSSLDLLSEDLKPIDGSFLRRGYETYVVRDRCSRLLVYLTSAALNEKNFFFNKR